MNMMDSLSAPACSIASMICHLRVSLMRQGIDDGQGGNRHFRSALARDVQHACKVDILRTTRNVRACLVSCICCTNGMLHSGP